MTRKLTPDQLDEIEAAAKEATPGPWEVIGGGEYVTPIGLPAGFDDCGVSPRDVHYIAAFDPPTVLALIAEVRELRAKVERVREIIDGPDYAEAQLALVDEALGDEA